MSHFRHCEVLNMNLLTFEIRICPFFLLDMFQCPKDTLLDLTLSLNPGVTVEFTFHFFKSYFHDNFSFAYFFLFFQLFLITILISEINSYFHKIPSRSLSIRRQSLLVSRFCQILFLRFSFHEFSSV